MKNLTFVLNFYPMALEKGPNWSEAIESLVNTLGAKFTLMQSTSVNLFHGKKSKKNSSQTNINCTIGVHPKGKSTGSNNRLELGTQQLDRHAGGSTQQPSRKIARKAVNRESTQQH
jgi:hypothetical protein